MKKIKSLVLVMVILLVTFTSSTQMAMAETVASIPLSNGGRVDIHNAHENSTGQYHGHEYDRKGNKLGAENLDGSLHDSKSGGFTNKTKKELEDNDTWEKYKDRNTGTEGYKNKHKEDDNKEDDNKASVVIGVGLAALLVITLVSPIPGDEALAASLLLVP